MGARDRAALKVKKDEKLKNISGWADQPALPRTSGGQFPVGSQDSASSSSHHPRVDAPGPSAIIRVVDDRPCSKSITAEPQNDASR